MKGSQVWIFTFLRSDSSFFSRILTIDSRFVTFFSVKEIFILASLSWSFTLSSSKFFKLSEVLSLSISVFVFGLDPSTSDRTGSSC